MRTYTVHLKPGHLEPAHDSVLVREGWSWAGLFFGPLWLLSQRAWIPALLEIAIIAVLVALAPLPGLLGLPLFNALLGRDLVRWSLDRRGFALRHVVIAPDRDAALLRLLAARPDLMGSAR